MTPIKDLDRLTRVESRLKDAQEGSADDQASKALGDALADGDDTCGISAFCRYQKTWMVMDYPSRS